MKLLLDACVPIEWLEFLRHHNHDCIAWLHIGPPTAADSQIMQYALTQQRIVLTHDLDFGRLLAFSKAVQPSVIQFRAADIRPAARHGKGDILLY